tara:strand:- start:540 stop:1334 length:795 start_codon:yes stop_codon:yes gene_type:complete
MVENNSFTRVAFTGNTRLTFECIKATLNDCEVVAVFGLSETEQLNKTNSVSLDNFCDEHNIKLFKCGDWNAFKEYCKTNDVDSVITIGDSRIVPKTIIDEFFVIGNHGALLPYVHGGASLVWGRMVDTGQWGISIMQLDEKVDAGNILKTKPFSYDNDMSEQEFVDTCDELTVKALTEVLRGDYILRPNRKCDVKVSKHTDSKHAVEILRYCIDNDLCVYMPPRTPDDSVVKEEWCQDFKRVFKIAQNKPYPKYKHQNLGKVLS